MTFSQNTNLARIVNLPVVKSLLETDLYKFTMLQAMLHKNPGIKAEYNFVCRNESVYPLAELIDDVNFQLDMLCRLRFTREELDYLGGLRFIKTDFIDFLKIFQFQRENITVSADGDKLKVVAKGSQIHIMGFEIHVLAIVNELYFRRFDQKAALTEGRKRLQAKIELLRETAPEGFEFFDFGLRRRFSGDWHEEVVATLSREVPQFFKGTSNVHLARLYNLVPIGTMAHEYLQSYQATGVRLRDFQKQALEDWVQEYRGDLGIALTDVIGMDAFLEDFDLFYAKLFDGLRHDSGEPKEWGDKAIAHYKKLRIDPMTKRLVFSDGLTVQKAIDLYGYFKGKAMSGYGIGTSLSNDVGLTPLNIVMKIIECNGQPVAKLSDSAGKTLCEDETFLAYLRQVFNVQTKN